MFINKYFLPVFALGGRAELERAEREQATIALSLQRP